MPRTLIYTLTALLLFVNHAVANDSKEAMMPALSYSTTVIYVKENAKQVLDFYQQAFGFH